MSLVFEGLQATLLYCCNYVRQINKVMNNDDDDDDNGDEPVLLSQMIETDCPDLRAILSPGMLSAKVGDKAGSWRAYSAINYEATEVILEAGRSYPTNESKRAAIPAPVLSIRKV